mmetsp:Transcript_3896/g.3275  ORF Transcript_3896/g.3275 Transcript_3896/m.3275 type:complete len:106 (-) Transcript_3896:136-453(-)
MPLGIPPRDLAHSYPFVQAGMSSAQDLLPSARVADFLLHQWEEGREKTRRQCGDKPHNFKPGSITYVVKSKRPTKLGSQVSGGIKLRRTEYESISVLNIALLKTA